MSLPNVNITLGNGNIGSVTLSDDGISGLVLSGKAVGSQLLLNKVYVLSGTSDLKKLGITKENNPLLLKDITAFYSVAGDGAELHLLVVDENKKLSEICSADPSSPLKALIDSAAGRIRLVGINVNPGAEYEATVDKGIDQEVMTAATSAQQLAKSYLERIAPFVVLLPALAWSGTTSSLYKPREGSQDSVSVVLASDGKVGEGKFYSAAIGQVLGRLATCPVNISLARVRDGSIAAKGWLTDGKTPEEDYSLWGALHDAGYIFYRTFIGKNGYYLNYDATSVPETDDYNRLSLTRVIHKALVVCYKTYIDEIMDSIEVDPETGRISTPMCKYYEQLLVRNINASMEGEISGFAAYVDPKQDLISTNILKVQAKVVPTALLKEINVDLSFNNPFNSIKQ